MTLGELPVGARLLVRSKKDWRVAVVSKFTDEKATLIVSSPMGRNYRLRRALDAILTLDGNIPLLQIETEGNWRDNFSNYDLRW